MSISSFSAGLSGLSASATQLTVIGNNLANMNTVGFKASSVSFVDLVSRNTVGAGDNPAQIGLGVATGSISPVFSQGAIESSGEATNAAIQGNGMFVVRAADGSVSYTRAGNFSFDRDGRLVTADGAVVQGYTTVDPVTGGIQTTGTPADITIPPGALRAPQATTNIRAQTNLNAAAPAGTTFTTAVQVYDGLGQSHVATLTYTRAAGAGAWDYAVTVPGDEVAGGTPGTPFQVGAGTLTFDANGQLATVNGGTPADVVLNTPAWQNGAAASTWTWDLVDANNVASLTGFAAPSATSSIVQNGTAARSVESIAISADGTILATFGGGQTIALGQLALATFNNQKGLVKLGSNRFSESPESGVPNVGVPGTGGRGTLIGSALERSNVDIASEFTQMILAQRGYQANAKTITVSDELLMESLALKR